jgi:hypothetical protein
MAEPEITKRRVDMINIVAAGVDDEGRTITHEYRATDYVRPDFLDAYLADARTKWQVVTVADEPDAGPAGYDGPTFVPANLDHELAGQYFPATTGSVIEAELVANGDAAAIATEGSDEPVLLASILEG